MSPSLPPAAGFGLLKNTLAGTVEVAVVIVLAGTLAVTPPPVKYLIINVVLFGAIPYDLLYKKLEGSNALSIVVFPLSLLRFKLAGSGKITESSLLFVPAPN